MTCESSSPRISALSIIAIALLATTNSAPAQWQMQDAHTTANLRGIDSIGKGIAWASGSNGTVLRTEDGGFVWQLCATPPGAADLDLRGIQALDADTAIVMSSGKGNLSRIYKTTDGCQNWKLIFTNPDADGFFDAMQLTAPNTLYVLGDPVSGKFAIYFTDDGGTSWLTASGPERDSAGGDGAFAASNSALTSAGPFLLFGASAGTAGATATRLFHAGHVRATARSSKGISHPMHHRMEKESGPHGRW